VVQCLALSPNFAEDGLVLAGTEADGLLRSTDSGTIWHRPPGLAAGGVAALAFDTPGRTVAAATESGIAISLDGGDSWQRSSMKSRQPVLSVVFSGQAFAGRTPSRRDRALR